MCGLQREEVLWVYPFTGLIERKSASLARRGFRGAHTHGLLDNIYYKYNLDVTKVNGILYENSFTRQFL